MSVTLQDYTLTHAGYDPEMAWTMLLLAALLEVAWAIWLKYTQGFTKLWTSSGRGSRWCSAWPYLSWSARTLPIGTAYAVWTGIGAAGTAVLGVYFFGVAASAVRVVGVGLIVLGVALLKGAG